MNNKKTSKKRAFSLSDMPILKVKSAQKVLKADPKVKLRSKEFISKALWQALVDNDVDAFKEILRAHLEVINKEKLVRDIGLSRRTLFRMLSDDGNPTLENISRVIHGLCA